MAITQRRLKDCRKESYFLQFANNVASQGGEDGIIEEIFKLIGCSNSPFCVDIGAWDGKHLSNTYNLIYNNNWGGYLVEANADRASALAELYTTFPNVLCQSKFVQLSGDNSLLNLLQVNKVPQFFDFLSIDIDGADYHLWESIGNLYKPRVVCIEFNPTFSNHIYFIQECDINVNQGSSLLALSELGSSLDYTLVATTTFNAIFVHNNYLSFLPKCDYNINTLHTSTMVTDFFQTYDGEIHLIGPKKLLWHRLAINTQKLQILPLKDRKFPFAPILVSNLANIHLNIKHMQTLLNQILLDTKNMNTTTSGTLISRILSLFSSHQTLLTECRHNLSHVFFYGVTANVIEIAFLCIVTVMTTYQQFNENNNIMDHDEITRISIQFQERLLDSSKLLEDMAVQYSRRTQSNNMHNDDSLQWLRKSFLLLSSFSHITPLAPPIEPVRKQLECLQLLLSQLYIKESNFIESLSLFNNFTTTTSNTNSWLLNWQKKVFLHLDSFSIYDTVSSHPETGEEIDAYVYNSNDENNNTNISNDNSNSDNHKSCKGSSSNDSNSSSKYSYITTYSFINDILSHISMERVIIGVMLCCIGVREGRSLLTSVCRTR